MRTALIAVALAACTGSSNYWVTYQPRKGTITQPKADAVQHAVSVLTDAGKDIESSDATSGVVLSKWFTGDGIGSDSQRFRVRVTINDSGSYEVVALCQGKSPYTSAWNECEEQAKRPRFVVETVSKIEAALH